MSYQSVMVSHRPNMFKKAIEKLDTLIDNPDAYVALKAAVVAIEHHKGKPGQSVDLTSKNEKISSPIFLTSDPELKEMISKLSTGE